MQFQPLLPDVQITFYARLSELRNVLLFDALLTEVAKADIDILNKELSGLVSNNRKGDI
jgi:hypothetical protein